MDEFREVLETAGIGAELHAHLRKRLVDVLLEKKKVKISEKTEESKLLISLIANFFESENLEFSKSVLAAEAGFDFTEIPCDGNLSEIFKKNKAKDQKNQSTQTNETNLAAEEIPSVDSSLSSSF